MNLSQQIIAPLLLFISLTTASGVLVHDTNLDKAFNSAVGAVDLYNTPTDDSAKISKLSPSLHTHPEHTSLKSILRDNQAHPRFAPRPDDRKYVKSKSPYGGNSHEFDGYRLYVGGICL